VEGVKYVTTSKRRDRSVVFRVTQQEYNCIKSDCEASGGRSLSEYTRSELLSSTRGASSDPVSLQRFLEIDRKLTEICQLTQQILEYLRAGSKGRSSSSI